MPEKDQPPPTIWLDDEALRVHFDRVKESYTSGHDRDDETVPLSQNELTRDLRR